MPPQGRNTQSTWQHVLSKRIVRRRKKKKKKICKFLGLFYSKIMSFSMEDPFEGKVYYLIMYILNELACDVFKAFLLYSF